jgi:curved DNA-binding protein CbpA
MKDYYSILGLSSNASERDIKTAFKRLAVQFHPDKNPNNPTAEERFKQINEAYQILSDPASKARYDYATWTGGQASAATPEPESNIYYDERDRRWRTRNYTQTGTATPPVEQKKSKAGLFFVIGAVVVLSVIVILNFEYLIFLSKIPYHRELRQQAQQQQQQLIANIKARPDAVFIDKTLDSLNAARAEDLYMYSADLIDKLEVMLPNLAKSEMVYGNTANAAALFMLWKKRKHKAELETDSLLAQCLATQQKYAEAEEVLLPYSQKSYHAIRIYTKIGDMYKDAKMYPKALEYYQKITDNIIELYIAEYGKAYAVVLDGKERSYEEYAAFSEKAFILGHLHQYKEAISVAKWAERLRPKSARHQYALGHIYHNMGKTKDACLHWAKAYEAGDNDAYTAMDQYCK